jgi:hypothetical protein
MHVTQRTGCRWAHLQSWCRRSQGWLWGQQQGAQGSCLGGPAAAATCMHVTQHMGSLPPAYSAPSALLLIVLLCLTAHWALYVRGQRVRMLFRMHVQCVGGAALAMGTAARRRSGPAGGPRS